MKTTKNHRTSRTPKKRREHRFRTPIWRAKFLEELARSGNVLLSCKKAGVGRSTVYEAKHADPAFSEHWLDALEEAADLMEAVAQQRAIHGTLRPVFQGGQQVGAIREYSDTLLIFLLKAHRPERFRDNYDLKKIVDAITKQTSC